MSIAESKEKLLTGICPDEHCQGKLFFPFYDTSIECTYCGQRHERGNIKNVIEISDPNVIFTSWLRSIVLSSIIPKRGPEMVLVLGLSNYHCKLLSPLLTEYGMDNRTGEANLLCDMNQGDMFDCGVLHDRSFLIDPEHLNVVGYGYDVSGSLNYLAGTLDHIKAFNDGEQRLIPIHADGDGHCLVHAVSRALVGREIFWHPLRCNLKRHLQENLHFYKSLFKEFVDDSDWTTIIDECDPKFTPPEGELLGLRNIHVFSLANVLKRPIILLDSIAGMQSLGDYSALFLPVFVEPSKCRGKDGTLNKPLCLAWSSSGRNHYIPLVGLKNAPLPKLHRSLVPKAWGTAQSLIDQYIEFDETGCFPIGGNRVLGDSYVFRLTKAMDKVFLREHGVHPTLVADMHHYVYRRIGVVGALAHHVIRATQKAVKENRLYRCLTCNALVEQHMHPDWFENNGILYKIAKERHGQLLPNTLYEFPMHGIVCTYNSEEDKLIPNSAGSQLGKCTWCRSTQLRLARNDGSIVYHNKDKTRNLAVASQCFCGYKHFWEGKEYDNLPQEFLIKLEWNKKVVNENVAWFQFESDPSYNSNAYEIATQLVQKHFPGEFGSERLVKDVVDQILERTKGPENLNQCLRIESQEPYAIPEKLIVTGPQLLQKEELGVSRTERELKEKVAKTAPSKQKRQTNSAETLLNHKSQKSNAVLNKDSNIKSTSVPVKQRIVKVSTSDGRTGVYDLDKSPLTFWRLQDWVEEQFSIPSSKQKLKCGIPPKTLHPPAAPKGSIDIPSLPLGHGDRVIVEIIPDLPPQSALNALTALTETMKLMRENLNENPFCQIHYAECPWKYVQGQPHLFKKDGWFYKEARDGTGLEEGRHYRFEGLNWQVFRYSKFHDRLELCLQPYGHFEVRPGVEGEALRVSSQRKGRREPIESCQTQNCSREKPSTSADGERVALEPVLLRRGPGFSVLSPPTVIETPNPSTPRTEDFRNLIASIVQFQDESNEDVSDGRMEPRRPPASGENSEEEEMDF